MLPLSLRFKPPVRSVKGYKFMENTGFSFLRLRIDQCHHSTRCLLSLFSRSLSELFYLIDNSEILWVEETACCSKERHESFKQKELHGKKLRNLLSKSCPDPSGSNLKDKWVLNLSSKELSELERRGLEFLNFPLHQAKFQLPKLSLRSKKEFFDLTMIKSI